MVGVMVKGFSSFCSVRSKKRVPRPKPKVRKSGFVANVRLVGVFQDRGAFNKCIFWLKSVPNFHPYSTNPLPR